jgi:hypothetical protein
VFARSSLSRWSFGTGLAHQRLHQVRERKQQEKTVSASAITNLREAQAVAVASVLEVTVDLLALKALRVEVHNLAAGRFWQARGEAPGANRSPQGTHSK